MLVAFVDNELKDSKTEVMLFLQSLINIRKYSDSVMVYISNYSPSIAGSNPTPMSSAGIEYPGIVNPRSYLVTCLLT